MPDRLNNPNEANSGDPLRGRPWHRTFQTRTAAMVREIRRASVFFGLFGITMASALLLNVVGTCHVLQSGYSYFDHGWPLTFMKRETSWPLSQQANDAYSVRVMLMSRGLLDGHPLPSEVIFYPRFSNAIMVLPPQNVLEFHPVRLAVNVSIGLAFGIVLATSLGETVSRSIARFSIRAILLLIAFVALACWTFLYSDLRWPSLLNAVAFIMWAMAMAAVFVSAGRMYLRPVFPPVFDTFERYQHG